MDKVAKLKILSNILKRITAPTMAGKIYRDPSKAVPPFMLHPLKWVLPKKAGDKLFSTVTRVPMEIDERLGRLIIGDIKGVKPKRFIKKIFTRTENVPFKNSNPNKPKKYTKHYVPSVMGPVKATAAVTTPILASMKISEILDKNKAGGQGMDNKVLVDKNLINKTASAIDKVAAERDGLREKIVEIEKTASIRKKAEELAFRMVNKGMCPQFETYEDFQEKVASIMTEDIAVTEKALEMTPKLAELGQVSNVRGRGGNSFEEFVLE